MKTGIKAWIVTMALVAGASAGWGQRGESRGETQRGSSRGVINYEDLSKRNTRSTEREDRKKKEAEAAKRKAEEEKRREDRRNRSDDDDKRRDDGKKGMSTVGGSKSTSGTKSAGSSRGNAGRAGKDAASTLPVTAGGSTDPTTQEVNEVILNAVKTQIVPFDVEAARKNPDVILLNEPQFNKEDRIRAGDTGMAQPL